MTARVRSNPGRRSRLFRAAYDGDLDTIRTLVAEGEDINVRSEKGSRVINVVAERDHVSCVAWCLENGSAVNVLDSAGQSPLINAIVNHNPRVAHLLLDHGASPDLFGKSDHPAAWLMSIKGDDTVLSRILDNVADIDVCDQGGKTLLFSAIEADHAEWVTELIARGASLERRNSTGGSALHVAGRTSADMVELLSPHFPDLNIRDFCGRTALHWAAKPECIRALVAVGADIDARDRVGNTPLITAINSGHMARLPTFAETYRPAIMELMSLGADLRAQNDKEESARSLIKQYKIRELYRVLAAIDARDSMAGVVKAAKARAAGAPT